MSNQDDNSGKPPPPPAVPQIAPAKAPPRVTAPTAAPVPAGAGRPALPTISPAAPVVPPAAPAPGTPQRGVPNPSTTAAPAPPAVAPRPFAPIITAPGARPAAPRPAAGAPAAQPPAARPALPTIAPAVPQPLGAPQAAPAAAARPTIAPAVPAPIAAPPRAPVIAPIAPRAPVIAPPAPVSAAPVIAPPVIAPPVIAPPVVAPPRAPVIAPPAPPAAAPRPQQVIAPAAPPMQSSPSRPAIATPAAPARASPLPASGAIETISPQQASELRRLALSLDDLDYFQVLGLNQAANAGEIKKAFYRESRTYHPDRFFHLPPSQEKDDVGALYRRITEAYYVLRDDAKRKKYLGDLGGPERAAKLRYTEATESELKAEARKTVEEEFGTNPKSRPFFKSGMADYEKQNWAAAERNFKMGLTYEPGNARFKEKLAEVQAKIEEQRRKQGPSFLIK